MTSGKTVDRNADRRLPVGVEVLADGEVHARVWAPKRTQISIVLDDGASEIALSREAGEAGYFSGPVPGARAGSRYRFRLDGGTQLVSDPVSRFQPDGVHGASQVVDPRAFRWTDDAWKGCDAHGNVLYELHVGTFTPQGTWRAAIEKLPHLADVGINCIEMMPVNEFGGRWNWGYDGVGQFAPTRNYGAPDDLRAFIDACHNLGIGVILDVVYNHFGPDGCVLDAFSDTYFTDKHKNDWGKSLNFDGPGSAGVREFFVANARYWIEEFRFDGFRFDATQAILDDTRPHVLVEICNSARAAGRALPGGRDVYLINENEPQHTTLVRPQEKQNGIGMDALWNDDFHHSARVALTGRRDAYFTDYKGTAQELLSAVKWGYLYQGQRYKWQNKRRGTPGLDLLPTAFVNYIQNHDQIANYAHGERLYRHTSLAHIRAITALMLLAPQTPMLFMGQEWGATARFNFFSDLPGDLPRFVATGRKRETSQFPTVGSPEMLTALPDPSDPRTFERCKLDWTEREGEYNQQWLRLHRDLIALRRDDPIISSVQSRHDLEGAVVGPWAFVLRYFGSDFDDRMLLINLDADQELDIAPEPLLAPPFGKAWTTILSTEDPKYGGNGHVPPETRGESWRLPGENWRLLSRCTTVLKAVDQSVVDVEERAKAIALAHEKGEAPPAG